MTPHLLIVGDVMLDQFVYGDVTRISPEASTPVLLTRRITRMLGGAGHVARGVAALGARCTLFGVVGDDEDGEAVENDLRAANITSCLIVDARRQTTSKVRYVSIQHSSHLLRVDNETTTPITDATLDVIAQKLLVSTLPDVKCVILSDYNKGVLRPPVINAAMNIAYHHGVPSIVDPKQPDWRIYSSATILKPNLAELGLPFDAPNEVIEQKAQEARKTFMLRNVLVTCGERGMMLIGKTVTHIPAHPVKVRDVSGAGDTVVAALAVALAEGATIEAAVHMANDAAAISVGKNGTAVVTRAELAAKGKMVPADDWTLLDQRLAEWRTDGQSIGFTNGCFDLIHPGHVKLLQEARAACDKLVIGLNSDASVKALKGAGRPVQHEEARAAVLSAMDAVDLVVIFPDPTPIGLIKRVLPDVLIKGANYKGAVGSGLAKRTLYVDLLPGHSTSRLIGRSA
jgi:D-beta-D-heptose 7-phosphate kinase/D-beta-D-heptose 1-phosphate adenosyltransferase